MPVKSTEVAALAEMLVVKSLLILPLMSSNCILAFCTLVFEKTNVVPDAGFG